jgi:hypothetical protein
MSRRPLTGHESVRITKPVHCDETVYGRKNVTIPAGSTGAVVAIADPPAAPPGYIVDFRLEEIDDYAWEWVPAEFVEPRHGWPE